MYLAEVDEQLIMANSYSDGFQEGRSEGLAEGRTEGRKEGRKEGRAEGHTELLLQLVSRKYEKGKTLEQIAEELENDVETIRPIYDKMVKLPSNTR